VVVQCALFALQPYEDNAEHEHPTKQQIDAYQKFIEDFIAGLHDAGDPPIIIILQPDMPFVYFQYTDLHIMTHMHSLHNAMLKFHNSGLTRASVYLEAGAGDWPLSNSVPDWPRLVAWMLEQAGVRYARGIATDGTHSTSEEFQQEYSRAVLEELGKIGIHGKHFVTNAGSNGHPYTNQMAHSSGAPICSSPTQHLCKSTGMPPGIFTDGGLQDARIWFSIDWQGPVGGARPLPQVVDLIKTSPYYADYPRWSTVYNMAQAPARHLHTSPRWPMPVWHSGGHPANAVGHAVEDAASSAASSASTMMPMWAVVLVVVGAILVAVLVSALVAIVWWRRRMAAVRADDYHAAT